jgi:hypothetical protein
VNPIMLSVGLVGLGFMAVMPCAIILNIAGLPGAILAFGELKSGKYQAMYYVGSLVSFLCQAFVYFCYMTFIIKSVQHIPIGTPLLVSSIVWVTAFFAAIHPSNVLRTQGIREHYQDSTDLPNPSVIGGFLTWIASLIAFFVFAFAPNYMEPLWGWVPSL